MQDIAAAYKREEHRRRLLFASSSTLARQIEAGAPADLFISADQKWMDYAVDKKAVDTTTRETLLGNSLVVVAPKASPQGDIAINKETHWTRLLNGGGWRWAIRTMYRLEFTRKRPCRNWARGRHCLQIWRRRKTYAVRWRWWSAMRLRWALSTARMLLPAKVKVVGTFPEDAHKKVEYPVAIVDGHKNATVTAFRAYLKGRKRPQSLNVMDLRLTNDIDRS